MATDDKVISFVTKFAIGMLIFVIVVVALGSWASIRQINFFREDCVAAGGHVDEVGTVPICLDPEGRVLDINRRIN